MDIPAATTQAATVPKILTKEDHLWLACGKHAKNQETCYRIMTGVFVADSGWCTAGVGSRTLNCGNMRPGSGKYGDPSVTWSVYHANGNGQFRKYATIEDGINDNVALFSQLYEGQSVDYMRRVWAGGNHDWAATVNKYLYQ